MTRRTISPISESRTCSGFWQKTPNKLGTPVLGIRLCPVPQISELYPARALVVVLLLGLLALAACRPATPTPPPPTPTAYPVALTPAIVVHDRHPPTPPPEPGSPSEATTVLLLGTDRRGSGGGTNNTDTLLLFHLDPNARRLVVLSIPRDLYMEIPGHGQDRVNAAYAWGEQDGTGGLALARQTVSATLGLPVQHAALLDFHAFVTLVDAIGGIDVNVPYAIADPTYPDDGDGYDPFYLPAGPQHLDGTTALKYARTRFTPGGDFDRGARQRQVVLAVRDRITQFDLLPSLIAQSPQLWSALQSAFETGLTLGEMVDLAVAGSRIPADQIVAAGIDQTCTYDWTTPAGAQVLLPNQAAVAALIARLFAPPPAAASAQ